MLLPQLCVLCVFVQSQQQISYVECCCKGMLLAGGGGVALTNAASSFVSHLMKCPDFSFKKPKLLIAQCC